MMHLVGILDGIKVRIESYNNVWPIWRACYTKLTTLC